MVLDCEFKNETFLKYFYLPLKKQFRTANYILTGSPWDPWTKPWLMFLSTFGDDKYLLYVYGKSTFIKIFT